MACELHPNGVEVFELLSDGLLEHRISAKHGTLITHHGKNIGTAASADQGSGDWLVEIALAETEAGLKSLKSSIVLSKDDGPGTSVCSLTSLLTYRKDNGVQVMIGQPLASESAVSPLHVMVVDREEVKPPGSNNDIFLAKSIYYSQIPVSVGHPARNIWDEALNAENALIRADLTPVAPTDSDAIAGRTLFRVKSLNITKRTL